MTSASGVSHVLVLMKRAQAAAVAFGLTAIGIVFAIVKATT